jgi:hypothetical protein
MVLGRSPCRTFTVYMAPRFVPSYSSGCVGAWGRFEVTSLCTCLAYSHMFPYHVLPSFPSFTRKLYKHFQMCVIAASIIGMGGQRPMTIVTIPSQELHGNMELVTGYAKRETLATERGASEQWRTVVVPVVPRLWRLLKFYADHVRPWIIHGLNDDDRWAVDNTTLNFFLHTETGASIVPEGRGRQYPFNEQMVGLAKSCGLFEGLDDEAAEVMEALVKPQGLRRAYATSRYEAFMDGQFPDQTESEFLQSLGDVMNTSIPCLRRHYIRDPRIQALPEGATRILLGP